MDRRRRVLDIVIESVTIDLSEGLRGRRREGIRGEEIAKGGLDKL